jgi:selenocysteine-specific elongation factor
MPREELKSRSKEENRGFNALLKLAVQAGSLVESGASVRVSGFEVRFNPGQEKAVNLILRQFADQPYSPPSVKDVQAALGLEVAEVLIDNGHLVRVSPEVVFRGEDYSVMLEWVRKALSSGKTLSAAEFRDQFNTSRKYALAFLEYLDAQGITVRDGDVRKLKKPA